MTHTVHLGWPIAGNTGWGLLGLHVTLGLQRHGWDVRATGVDYRGITATLSRHLGPQIGTPYAHSDVRIDAYGNHWPAYEEMPHAGRRVVYCVIEDTVIPDRAVEALSRYDLVLSPSSWVQSLLASRGIHSTVWHQGYDESLFRPAPRRRPAGPVYVFSGGKLEFRKGQDVVVAAFRRFRETPEGRDAVLVTAWQNLWPATMEGIWSAGHVRGVPSSRGGLLDICGWLAANGVPREASIDLGMLSQPELAAAMRECDVAIQPSRCEGAVDMPLCEAMGLGLPVVATTRHGHRDIRDIDTPLVAVPTTPVTIACPLYAGMDGWAEPDVESCVTGLVEAVRQARGDRRRAAERHASAFGWLARSKHLHSLLADDSIATAVSENAGKHSTQATP